MFIGTVCHNGLDCNCGTNRPLREVRQGVGKSYRKVTTKMQRTLYDSTADSGYARSSGVEEGSGHRKQMHSRTTVAAPPFDDKSHGSLFHRESCAHRSPPFDMGSGVKPDEQ